MTQSCRVCARYRRVRRLAFALLAGCGALPQGEESGDACGDDDDALAPAPATTPVLDDATTEAGLPEQAFACVIFDDLDGDELPDLLLDVTSTDETLHFVGDAWMDAYRNRGDGTFEHVPVALPAPGGMASACDAGDFDNDGLPDLAVGLFTDPATSERAPGLALLRNVGGLQFEDATGLLPSDVRDHDTATAIGFFDLDSDGYLDLYANFYSGTPSGPITCSSTEDDFVCHYAKPAPEGDGRLLPNRQAQGFDALSIPGGAINSVSFLDWDRDARTDILVTVDFSSNRLYRNVDGTGALEDIAPELGIDRYNHGMGSAVGDFNGDGEWDLYVADMGPDQFYFGVPDDERLEERAGPLGVAAWTRLHSGWAPLAADFNHDGFLDLFLVNTALMVGDGGLRLIGQGGTVSSPTAQSDFLYTNRQDGTFSLTLIEHQPNSRPLAILGVVAAGDYDGDGDLDLAETYLAPWRFRLLRNDTPAEGHWLMVRLEGTASNREARGAEVVLLDDGRPLHRRVVHGLTGSIGRSSMAVHFGLGTRRCVDAVEVRWPSGRVQRIAGPVSVDQLLRITEE